MTITTELSVTGMTCSHCVASVTEELSEIAGVRSVDVTLVNGGASAVTVASDAPLDDAAISAAIDEAGYTLVSAARS
jgi:copper chaperone CopZ